MEVNLEPLCVWALRIIVPLSPVIALWWEHRRIVRERDW